jgi:alanine racemase
LKLLFSTLQKITSGVVLQAKFDTTITDIFIDSRNAIIKKSSLFIAIKGIRHDGHQFIEELYQKGVRNFIVEAPYQFVEQFPKANFLQVPNSTLALQQIAAKKRIGFQGKLISITGSNGKTITKEWLGQLLQGFYNVYRSPRSYNSQVGVPLALWPVSNQYDYAIIEAGISRKGEMESLEAIIKPEIGIFTNIGTAHDEGFSDLIEKTSEKAKLFKDASTIIFCTDYPEIAHALYGLENIQDKNLIGWSFDDNTSSYFVEVEERDNHTAIRLPFNENLHIFEIPFKDYASLENVTHCILCLLHEGIPSKLIQKALTDLKPVSMRLEVKQAIHQSFLVDDSYNNDLVGLDTALQFFRQQKQQQKRVIILSDLLESGLEKEELYQSVAERIKAEKLNLFIGIGPDISANADLFPEQSIFFDSTEEFLETLRENPIKEAVILIKGARTFRFERIAKLLEQKVHGTVLEINLNALTHNLNFYRSKLRPHVKTMAMVKAFAYGSGSHEIANWLQFQQVDYLAVAYADEGVALRERGIHIPIMVMNPTRESFDLLLQHNLEPELYSFEILTDFINYSRPLTKKAKVHIKLDTGMHRLGFEVEEIGDLIELLLKNTHIKVASIFSHLAASDEARHNGFSARQALNFKHMAEAIKKALNYHPLMHILNSPGISRFPDFQFDMVRLGVGMYGVDATSMHQDRLMTVSSLKTVVSQVKHVKKRESIGYARRGLAENDMKIATIAIGYADGFDRKFSNGVGKVLINGQLAPVIGNVCMDMTMVDVTDIICNAGDVVTVYGEKPTIFDMAESIDTIPYEILTNVSTRVKRVFYSE